MANYMLDVHFSTIFVAMFEAKGYELWPQGQESIPKDFQEPTVSKNERESGGDDTRFYWTSFQCSAIMFSNILHSVNSVLPRRPWLLVLGIVHLELEMCGNGFQHSHSLPFPSIQFPFPPISIPDFLYLFPFPWDSRVGYSFPFLPTPILSMLKLYIISDTVIIICS